MRETYDPAEVESVQQAHWRAKDIYRAVEHALDANGKENRNLCLPDAAVPKRKTAYGSRS